jgi:thioredoxin-dependent peroxiredoxin
VASHLRAGDPAPPFAVPDQHGNIVRLEDFAGRTLLLYFFPAAFSVDCTAQGCSIRDHTSGLSGLSIDVVGISPDPVDRQREFDARFGLGFPLLADVDHAVAASYGVWSDYEYDGAIVTGVLRSSFLVDDGVITHVWSPVRATETAPLVLAALGGGPHSVAL